MIKPIVGIKVPSAFSNKNGIALLPLVCTGFPLVLMKLELSSVLLLGALVGAAIIARPRKQ
jgi:NADH:ubiquinone oxidoreductase subunit 6 (subunit J)